MPVIGQVRSDAGRTGLCSDSHWQLWGPLAPAFTVHQPWVIGYNAEGGFGGMQNMVVFSRLWIDQELKTEMGH